MKVDTESVIIVGEVFPSSIFGTPARSDSPQPQMPGSNKLSAMNGSDFKTVIVIHCPWSGTMRRKSIYLALSEPEFVEVYAEGDVEVIFLQERIGISLPMTPLYTE